MSSSNVIPYDTNVSNFVSVKLSGKHNYLFWKAQMLCLLNSINICGILDNTFVRPRDSGPEIVRQYDNLVKGWIFGSVSEVVLEQVYNLDSAKEVWENLQSNYDVTTRLQQDTKEKADETEEDRNVVSTKTNTVVATDIESHPETKTQDIDDASAETNTIAEGPVLRQVIVSENKTERKNKLKRLKSLVIQGDWPELNSMLKEDISLANEAISSDGSTIFHIAIGIGHNDIMKKLLLTLLFTFALQKKRDYDGSTALHIAAIVGNKVAALLLVACDNTLLRIKDNNNKTPLEIAYDNMHLDTIAYLLQAVKKHCPENLHVVPDDKAVRLIVNAIYAKRYRLVKEFMIFFPNVASRSDDVLMALAKTFPNGLDDDEKLIYPSLKGILEMLRKTAWVTLTLFVAPAFLLCQTVIEIYKSERRNCDLLLSVVVSVFLIVPFMLASAFAFICLLILIMCFPFHVIYYLLWKGANKLAFPPIKKIEKKIMEREAAKEVLVLVCNEIDEKSSSTRHPCYAEPILEAARQNAYDVVEEILARSPESIQSKDECGYDIIQLAIINRSDKIYNLIYDVDERKNLHKTYKDSSNNNILHLAGRLAPSSVLNQRTGAALQLQRELRWRKEVKKLVIPTYITQENSFKETPDMVFTREHKDLVKEGEEWMKTTAESCSITATLIITIVFAAAITVPGGNNEEGTPLFKKEPAFIVFAISDAISLFASSTAPLVFLSILTARFAEDDFLLSLPRRLFIGLFSLLLSTTTMMVSFSATLFLVFGDRKLWMLGPICVLALIPIAFFVGLQFPLMVDLFRSTFLPSIGKERKVTFKDLIRKTYEYMFHNS